MKKLTYLLSIAGHALLLLIALGADFPITIIPQPPRVIAVAIAEPPLPLVAERIADAPAPGAGTRHAAAISAKNAGVAEAGRGLGSGIVLAGGLPFLAPLKFGSTPAANYEFALTLPARSRRSAAALPLQWTIGTGAPSRPLRYPANAYSPLPALSGPGAPGVPGGVFLLPFDIRERAVADWAEFVLARIERNWIVPTAARFAFSGRIQVMLTIERSGRSLALAVEESSLPEPLSLAALHAVQASLPLPPLPGNIAGETFAFTFVFVYNG